VDGALDELKDLLEVVPVIDPQADWDPVLAVLKEYKGIDLVSRDAMRRLLATLRDVQRTGVLLGIVRHASGNPSYRPVVRPHRERIVEAFLSKNRSQVELLLQKISQTRTTQRIGGSCAGLLPTRSPARLASGERFTGRRVGVPRRALAYLRTFLRESPDCCATDFLSSGGRGPCSRSSSRMRSELLKISEATEVRRRPRRTAT
jgi:hypothetical protein